MLLQVGQLKINKVNSKSQQILLIQNQPHLIQQRLTQMPQKQSGIIDLLEFAESTFKVYNAYSEATKPKEQTILQQLQDPNIQSAIAFFLISAVAVLIIIVCEKIWIHIKLNKIQNSLEQSDNTQEEVKQKISSEKVYSELQEIKKQLKSIKPLNKIKRPAKDGTKSKTDPPKTTDLGQNPNFFSSLAKQLASARKKEE